MAWPGYGRSLSPPDSPLVEINGISAPIPARSGCSSFVPSSFRAAPALVVVLHGCGQTAAGYDLGAGWSTLAQALRLCAADAGAAGIEQRQHLLQLVQSGRHRARAGRSLLDPADDRADGRRSQHRFAPHLRHRAFRRRRHDVGDARDLSGRVRGAAPSSPACLSASPAMCAKR